MVIETKTQRHLMPSISSKIPRPLNSTPCLSKQKRGIATTTETPHYTKRSIRSFLLRTWPALAIAIAATPFPARSQQNPEFIVYCNRTSDTTATCPRTDNDGSLNCLISEGYKYDCRDKENARYQCYPFSTPESDHMSFQGCTREYFSN